MRPNLIICKWNWALSDPMELSTLYVIIIESYERAF